MFCFFFFYFLAEQDRQDIQTIRARQEVILMMMALVSKVVQAFMDHNIHFVRAFIAIANKITAKQIHYLDALIYVYHFVKGKSIHINY